MLTIFAPVVLLGAAWAIRGTIRWAIDPDPGDPLSRFVSGCCWLAAVAERHSL